MADESTNGAEARQPSINILAQYTKDFSFENPGAPRSLQSRDKAPNINISVNVNANPLSETDFDVVPTLDASAKDGDNVVFHAELSYGGLFRVQGFAQEHMLPVLFIECPRLLSSRVFNSRLEACLGGSVVAFLTQQFRPRAMKFREVAALAALLGVREPLVHRAQPFIQTSREAHQIREDREERAAHEAGAD